MIAVPMKKPIQRLNPFLKSRLWKLAGLIDEDMERLVRRRIASLQNEGKSDEQKNSQRDILSLTLSSALAAKEAELKSKAEDDDGKGNNTSVSEKGSLTEVSFSDNEMECIIAQLKTFYFAGHDTTATTISWAYWMLLKNPETLQRARDEVLEHLGKDWVDVVANGGNIPEET